MANIQFLECTRCGERISADVARTVCPKDGGALFVRYDLAAIRQRGPRPVFAGRPATLWRYREMLPDAEPVSLGEGFTPLLPSRTTPNVFIKDEGLNPTGSFKARGLALAITLCRHYGITKVAIPSAGNAAGALAAYAAAAGIEAHIFMPRDVPLANRVECDAYGAKVTLVDGLISDCARIVAERKAAEGWFDLSTMKEPFRVEGKKTMGYEIAEQMDWTLPDAILYPTGGGVGLIGMWKAFDEMEALGWLGSGSGNIGEKMSPKFKRPKMICVQSAGCAPILEAFQSGKVTSEMWQNAITTASGLRVPKPYADYLILQIVRQSQGTVVAATDAEIYSATLQWAREEGIFAAPEGAAALVAYQKLIASGFLLASDRVVLFNTGTGLKYLETYQEASAETRIKPRQIGGIISPY